MVDKSLINLNRTIIKCYKYELKSNVYRILHKICKTANNPHHHHQHYITENAFNSFLFNNTTNKALVGNTGMS